MRWRRWIACLTLLLIGGCICGCANSNEQLDRNLKTLDATVKAMRESGVEIYGFAELPLNAGMQNSMTFGNDGRVVLLLRVNPEPNQP